MTVLPLPEFTKPPVSEVALSVMFSPLEKWRSAHAGIYWSKIKDRYPLTENYPPIGNQIELFDQEPKPIKTMTFRVDVQNPDAQRYWFLAEPPTKLIQIQRDRFVTNWRKMKGDEVYPRYEKELRPRFADEWKALTAFLEEQGIGKPDVQQCEVFYINDILRHDAWENFKDALPLFSHWWAKSAEQFLPLPENLNMSGSFAMPDKVGRLHFTLQRVFRAIDEREAIQLQLFARGKPKSSSLEDILSWMDLGRDWIVRGFTDMTSPEAHKLWGRTR